jgi:hypothetical protein
MARIGRMKKTEQKTEHGTETVKTTIRLPKELWREARLMAIQEDLDLQDLVAAALVAYMKTVAKRGRDSK